MSSPWLWNGEPVDPEFVDGFAAFVYLIIEKSTGRKYIGKKFTASIRKVKDKFRKVRKKSDWEDYWSSSEAVKYLVDLYGEDAFERHILSLHSTRGDANITEMREQFARNVLEDPIYLNESIGGKYRRTTEKIKKSRAINSLTL